MHRTMAMGRTGFASVLLIGLLSACAKGRNGSVSRETAGPATESVGREPAEAASGTAPPSSLPEFEARREEREALVRTIEDEGVRDERVLEAMRKVPRHAFVLPAYGAAAYADHPLPIVGGQTISQPFIVAFMTESARLTPESRCLEIGTGSGYQAAVLAEICRATFSIEYLAEVARFGERNLRKLGYGPDRVALRTGDGYEGWPDQAPFDAILVTAAPEQVPKPLLDQLAVGGRLVVPVGAAGGVQALERWTRVRAGPDEGAFRHERLLAVQFVPFAGKHGSR